MEAGSVSEPGQPDPKTTSAILAHVSGALDQQLATSDAADTKALQLAAAGSVVIGLVAVGTKLAAAHVDHRWVLALAVIAYLAHKINPIVRGWWGRRRGAVSALVIGRK